MSDGDVVLVRFAWRDGKPAVTLRNAVDSAADPQVFRSLDGNEGYGYFDASVADALRAALADAAIVPMTLLMALSGASASSEAPYRYVVETDVIADREADFNAWYDDEHLAGLASVPGTVRAARYRDSGGHPRYHACYDLVGPETLRSEPWLAVRATPWSDRVRPTFVNTKRTMFWRCKTGSNSVA